MIPQITIIELAVKLAPLAIELLKALGKAIEAFAKALGGLDVNTPTDELGDKAIQAEEAGIKPENYSSYQEYVKAVEEFPLNPEKSQKITDAEKWAKGIELIANSIQEKYPMVNMPLVVDLAIGNPNVFTEKACKVLGEIVKNDPKAIETIAKFIAGDAKGSDVFAAGIKIISELIKAEKPELDDIEAAEKALNLKKEE